MKATVKRPVEIDAKFVNIEVAVRYGTEDIPQDFPGRKGDMWYGCIDIDEGRLLDWPNGVAGVLAMKVTDSGTYELLDADREFIESINQGYVPNELIPGEYGDYIDLQIDDAGMISNWGNPNLSDFFDSDEE